MHPQRLSLSMPSGILVLTQSLITTMVVPVLPVERLPIRLAQPGSHFQESPEYPRLVTIWLVGQQPQVDLRFHLPMHRQAM